MADSFDKVLRDAIDDMATHGFDTAERLAYWQARLREAAEAAMTSDVKMRRMLDEAMRAIYRRAAEGAGVLKMHPGLSRYNIDRLTPLMRRELDKRIMASADLIRLNKSQVVDETLRRFAGWATSIPVGGGQTNKRETKEDIRKSMSGLSFKERRVLIDQGHKLTTSISEVVATNSGALAGFWRSKWRQANYDYREHHKERDGELFVVRGNWAMERGLMKLAGHKYTDEITKPGEEVFCQCNYEYVYSLRRLPADMITEKGRAELERVKKEMAV